MDDKQDKVTVTELDQELLRALDVPASADNLLIAAFHRNQAEAEARAIIAELVGALLEGARYDTTNALSLTHPALLNARAALANLRGDA